VIECVSCHTLNPDAERTCLACSAALSRPAQTDAAAFGTARCPAGHPIDPSWRSCPYCDRQHPNGAAGRSTRTDAARHQTTGGPQQTRLDEAGPAVPAGADRRTRLEGEPAWPTPPSSPGPRPTRLEEPPAGPVGRRTVLEESRPAPPSAATDAPGPASIGSAPGTAAPARPLLAVLAAPDLGPGGTVFAVRGGKNTLGASRGNDIVLAGDGEVSGEHAVILYRNGTFHLTDRLSTNGTFLNGVEVPANGTVPLRDRDRIRCGGVQLVFLALEPAASGPAGVGDN
jgi:hypothetical protein